MCPKSLILSKLLRAYGFPSRCVSFPQWFHGIYLENTCHNYANKAFSRLFAILFALSSDTLHEIFWLQKDTLPSHGCKFIFPLPTNTRLSTLTSKTWTRSVYIFSHSFIFLSQNVAMQFKQYYVRIEQTGASCCPYICFVILMANLSVFPLSNRSVPIFLIAKSLDI